MPNKTFKDQGLRVSGNGTSVLSDITAYVNQVDLQRSINMLDQSALSDVNKRILPGLGSNSFPFNGFVNSTTDGILGPLIAASTSVSKRGEFKSYASRYYTFQWFPSNIKYSGRSGQLETFSGQMDIDGAITRTSVALT